MDYLALVAATVDDWATAFGKSLDSGDALAVAIVGMADPEVPGPIAVRQLQRFIDHDHPLEVNGDVLAGIFASCEEGELTAAAEQALNTHQDWPFSPENSRIVAELVTDSDQPIKRRVSIFAWLYRVKRGDAVKKAEEMLASPTVPYDQVSRIAVRVVGAEATAGAWKALMGYAKHHLVHQAEEGEAPHDQTAAVYVLDHAAHIRDSNDVGVLLAEIAKAEVAVEAGLDAFLGRITTKVLLDRVSELGEAGFGEWAAKELLPAALRLRPADIAGSASFKGWPQGCRIVFSEFDWETHDPALYAPAIAGLSELGETELRAEAMRRAAGVIEALDAGHPARSEVFKACFKICLNGSIAADDPSVVAIIQLTSTDELAVVLKSAGWRLKDRASRLGSMIAACGRTLLEVAQCETRVLGEATWIGLIKGTPTESLDAQAGELVGAVAGLERVLAVLCISSDAAAERALETWRTDGGITIFRALGSSPYEEERLSAIPEAVRDYGTYMTKDRAELLTAVDGRPEQLSAVAGILSDWAGHGPNADDLTYALGLLGKQLSEDAPIEPVMAAVAEICHQSRDNNVRTAAYAALENAPPIDAVVDLLLQRSEQEVSSMLPFVRRALDLIAGKLDQQATEADGSNRSHAIQQLARIDASRALPHARQLLTANRSDERRTGAKILGAYGEPDKDAQALRLAAETEPEAQVRREMERSAIKLEVGDVYEAHIRIGELAAIQDEEKWEELKPADVWDRWGELLVAGLNRLSQAEADSAYGEAIDALDELAKVVFFRTLESVGDQIDLNPKTATKVSTNTANYGEVLYMQQIVSKWKWASNFGALHERRSAHLAKKGETVPVVQPDASDLEMCFGLFRLGVAPCCTLLTGIL